MQYDPHPASPVSHPHHHGLLHLLDSFSTAFSAYHDDGQVVVGWLLAAWFLGFNGISALIWWQFERTEQLPADDYEIIVKGRRRNSGVIGVGEGGAGKGEGMMNPFDKAIVVVTLPSGDFSVAKKQKPQL
jgi:hypothetical protein